MDFKLELADGSFKVVGAAQIRQRVVLPWKPSALREYFIVFRRRKHQKEEYVEDLRVRRGLIIRTLKLLSKPGHWRPGQGVQPLHQFYNGFDWLDDKSMDTYFSGG